MKRNGLRGCQGKTSESQAKVADSLNLFSVSHEHPTFADPRATLPQEGLENAAKHRKSCEAYQVGKPVQDRRQTPFARMADESVRNGGAVC